MRQFFRRSVLTASLALLFLALGCESNSQPILLLDSAPASQPATSQPATTTAPATAPTKSQIIQPDYAAWKKIETGMTEAEVEKLLGKPIARQTPDKAYTHYLATYGRLQFDKTQFPVAYEFIIFYDVQNNTVYRKEDPFDGDFSEDGKPTTPQLVCPDDHAQFNHYPRFLDLRWQPSSGEYPITYEIELTRQRDADWSKQDFIDHHVSHAPYVSEAWVGAQVGYWRVRAKNRLGKSPWSETRQFEFSR